MKVNLHARLNWRTPFFGVIFLFLTACGGGGGGGDTAESGGPEISSEPGSDEPAQDTGNIASLQRDSTYGLDPGDGISLVTPSPPNLFSFQGNDAVLLPDSGKLLVAGTVYDESAEEYRMAVWCLNENGSLDVSFGGDYNSDGVPDGFYLHYSESGGNGITVDAGGKILVAGWIHDRDFDRVGAVWRLKADGSMDTSFRGFLTPVAGVALYDEDDDGDGQPDGRSEAMAIQERLDGRLVIAGRGTKAGTADASMMVWKLVEKEQNLPLGSKNVYWGLDDSFAGNGRYEYRQAEDDAESHGYALAVTATTKIFVAGEVMSDRGRFDMALWCLEDSGSLCADFAGAGGGGVITHDNAAGGNGYDGARALWLDRRSGDLIVGGYSSGRALQALEAALWKYRRDGESWYLDATFGGDADGDGTADGYLVFGDPDESWNDEILDLDVDASGRIAAAGRRGVFGGRQQLLWLVDPSGKLLTENVVTAFEMKAAPILSEFRAVQFSDDGTTVAAVGSHDVKDGKVSLLSVRYLAP